MDMNNANLMQMTCGKAAGGQKRIQIYIFSIDLKGVKTSKRCVPLRHFDK